MSENFLKYKYALSNNILDNNKERNSDEISPSSQMGYLCTYYNQITHQVKIIFTLDPISILPNSFILLGNKYGSRREEELLKLTLSEIGFLPNGNRNDYNWSCSLIKNLDLLGWPIGSKQNKVRKIIKKNIPNVD